MKDKEVHQLNTNNCAVEEIIQTVSVRSIHQSPLTKTATNSSRNNTILLSPTIRGKERIMFLPSVRHLRKILILSIIISQLLFLQWCHVYYHSALFANNDEAATNLKDSFVNDYKTSHFVPSAINNNGATSANRNNNIAVTDPHSSRQSTHKHRRHAYAFLMAGCKPSNPTYLGYIYNILIAAETLRNSGSTNDIIVMIRMSPSTNALKLPHDHELLLTQHISGIILKYIPKPKVDNFYSGIMDKFRVLELVDYSRVLFLDSDLIPFCNLDYMMELSEGDEASLAENVIIAFKQEPVSAGFFILKPDHDDYLRILDIIRQREDHADVTKDNNFDEVKGWGHEITAPDYWENLYEETGTKWSFYCAMADQGLLYHWTKYVKKNVSIIKRDKVETWGIASNTKSGSSSYTNITDAGSGDDNNEPVQMLHSAHISVLGSGCSPPDRTWGGIKNSTIRHSGEMLTRSPPFFDFEHFTGNAKPWLKMNMWKVPPDVQHVSLATSAIQFWYHVLRNIKNKYNLTMIEDVNRLAIGRPPLGLWPTPEEVALVKKANVQK